MTPGSNQGSESRKELEVLLASLVEGVLPAAQKKRLGELLKDDAEARLFYKRYLEVHAMLDWESGTVAMQQSDDDTLQDLLRMEQAAYAPIVEMPKVLHLRVADKKMPWQFVIPGAMAALVAIAIILIVTLPTGTSQPTYPGYTDNTPTKPADSSPPIPRGSAVATLTATHNAQWAERASARGSLTPGSKLHPGTRLTLIAGFAEITTARGAIAILEAPATIEFTHNQNALRLHAGKLVGICETPTSKGFLVRTPHMDITDLGTRFGVDSNRRATEVHVFEGEVQARNNNAAPDTQPTLLAANQSARTTADTNMIATIEHDADRFVTRFAGTIQLPGTGVGIRLGDSDPNWQIVAIDGKPLDTPQALRVAREGIYTEHFANDPATSQFVAWNPGVEPPVGGAIAYTFRTLIDVPEDIDPANARLVMRYIADNKVQAVVINGNRVEVDGHAFDIAYDQWAHCVIDEHLVSGSNTILFEIHNRRPDQMPTSNVGLRLQWELLSKPEVLQEINSQP